MNRICLQLSLFFLVILSVPIDGAQTFMKQTWHAAAATYLPTTQALTDSASDEKAAGPAVPIDLQKEPVTELPNQSNSGLPLETIRTETFEIHFSRVGAVPVLWNIVDESLSPNSLLTKSTLDGKVKMYLINPDLSARGLGRFLNIVLYPLDQQPDEKFNQMIYRMSCSKSDESYLVRFESPINNSGLQITKTYRIPQRGFTIELKLILINKTASELSFNKGRKGLGIMLGPGMTQDTEGVALHDHVEAVYKTSKDIEGVRLKKKDTSKIFTEDESNIEWAGLNSRYYMICLIPTTSRAEGRSFRGGKSWINPLIAERNLASENNLPNYPLVELFEAPFLIGSGKSVEFSYTVFAGPKARKILRAMPYALDKILFHDLWSWLRALCLVLMPLLGWLHSVFHNWGVAIIALSVLMRTITFPVTRYGMKQQKIFKEQQAQLKPLIDEIKKKYKDDADQRNEETMKLYREHNISPFASFKGCLWLLVQLPIFIALYQILSRSYEISGAGFLWIRDLSLPEMLFPLGVTLPVIGGYFNLLPILMGVVQLIQGYMMNQSSVSDPSSKGQGNKIIYVLPITMMILFYSFASGLLLYWTTTNICQIFEQWVVNKKGDSRARNG
jgi:YidC/Oxa1 family membrane protein insertase